MGIKNRGKCLIFPDSERKKPSNWAFDYIAITTIESIGTATTSCTTRSARNVKGRTTIVEVFVDQDDFPTFLIKKRGAFAPPKNKRA